ncbi:MAG TPA: hypothetical protein PJ984_04000 [Candidatus Saccharibacteria bacterium]|nr:hypothetical protein [Patescibacteria group bacterium]HMS31531.1 hypothetical protein [Candidatus Saccharibacteria bacterium]
MTDQEILQKLGLDNMPHEVQQQTLSQISTVVELRVAGALAESLSEEQKAKFEGVSKESPEKAWTWLSEQVTDVAKLYQAALTDYLAEVASR